MFTIFKGPFSLCSSVWQFILAPYIFCMFSSRHKICSKSLAFLDIFCFSFSIVKEKHLSEITLWKDKSKVLDKYLKLLSNPFKIFFIITYYSCYSTNVICCICFVLKFKIFTFFIIDQIFLHNFCPCKEHTIFRCFPSWSSQ